MRAIFFIIVLFFCGSAYAQDTPYKYYLGPWVWDADLIEWKSPAGTVGLVDLRSIPCQAQQATVCGAGFFASTESLDASYVYLGEGFISTLPSSDLIKDDWFLKTGYRPLGDTILDLLWDQLTVGSDPTGQTSVMPLMPDMKPALELYLSGHSLLRSQPFSIATHPHKEKVKAVYQEQFRVFKKLEKDGVAKKDFALKTLDFLGEKFKVADPENYFIPDDIPKEKPVKHETSYSETWDCTNADLLNCDQSTWTEWTGDVDIVSNAAYVQGASGVSGGVRLDSDLSSSDNYAQTTFVGNTSGSDMQWIVYARVTTTDNVTGYGVRRNVSGAGAFTHQLEKRVGGTTTALDGPTSLASAIPETWKIEANGSAIKAYLDVTEKHSITDTAVTTGVRGAFLVRRTGETVGMDDFEMADLSAPSSSIKTINGLAEASVKTVNGLANASVKTVNGLA